MKVHKFKHVNVAPNGKVKGGGAVGVVREVSLSESNGGCGLDGCNCSDGHWICISEGRDSSAETVQGCTIRFKDSLEMNTFIDNAYLGKYPTRKLKSLGLSELHIDILKSNIAIAVAERDEYERDEEGNEEEY